MMHYFIEDVVPVHNQFIRMNDERYRIRNILQTAPSITAGMAEWVKHCQSIHSDLIWEYFQAIDYEADIEHLIHRLEVQFIINPPPSDVGLYYFGMFTDIVGMSHKNNSRCDLVFYGLAKGAEYSDLSAIRYDPGPSRYMNSRVLDQIYKSSTDPYLYELYDGVIARFSELYSFLLIKTVFQQIPPLIHLRGKASVKVGVGTVPNFWEIGRLTPMGWEDIVLPPQLYLQLDDCCGVISGQIHARYAGEHVAYYNTLGQWVNAYFEPHPFCDLK